MKNKRRFYFLITIGVLVFLDQITKTFFDGKNYTLSEFFFIRSSHNTGSAFSLFSSVDIYNQLIIILSFVLLIVAIVYLDKIIKTKLTFSISALFLAGLLGNLIDRIAFSYVRDFIGVKWFAIFNIADIYLTFCALLLILHEFSENKSLKTKKGTTK